MTITIPRTAPEQAAATTTLAGGMLCVLPAIAAWGAALVLIALGSGAVQFASSPAPRVAGVIALTIGAAGLAGGVLALRCGPAPGAALPAPGAWIAGCLAVIATAGALLALDPARTNALAIGGLVALTLAVGVGAAGTLRRRQEGASANGRAIRGRTRGMLLAALLVAAVATPALGLTSAGALAPDHSQMPGMQQPGHHH